MRCLYPLCENPAHARGLCPAHYSRCARDGTLDKFGAPKDPNGRGRKPKTWRAEFPPAEDAIAPDRKAEILARIAEAKRRREAGLPV